MKMSISIIVLTHNCYTNKNGCIESVLLSILNQTFTNYEVIVIDNCSDDYNEKKLKLFVNCLAANIKIYYNNRNNISSGRNLGISKSNYGTIIFMDDDTILIDKKTLSKINELAKYYIYGYSAIRYWTPPNWYNEQRLYLNERLKSNSELYNIKFELPEPKIREKENNRHLIRTYIGNFGYVKKEAIIRVGLWNESYIGYGVEDDAMALELYLNYGRPVLLEDIIVIHIHHTIKESNYDELLLNRACFDKVLLSKGIKNFHVGRLLYNEPEIIEYII